MLECHSGKLQAAQLPIAADAAAFVARRFRASILPSTMGIALTQRRKYKADIRTNGTKVSDHSDSVPRRFFWLLPLVFVIHDAEELLTMPEWLTEHDAILDSLAQTGRLAAMVSASAPATTARAAVAIGLVFVMILLVTTGATLTRRRAWFYAYSSLLGLLFLHVFAHVVQALFFRSYVPGLFGAVFVVLPGTVFIYQRLFAGRLLNWKTAILTALAGFTVFVPGVLAAWAVGRMLAG
jgi:hypothetical protein